jgi:hypothetical protein
MVRWLEEKNEPGGSDARFGTYRFARLIAALLKSRRRSALMASAVSLPRILRLLFGGDLEMPSRLVRRQRPYLAQTAASTRQDPLPELHHAADVRKLPVMHC